MALKRLLEPSAASNIIPNKVKDEGCLSRLPSSRILVNVALLQRLNAVVELLAVTLLRFLQELSSYSVANCAKKNLECVYAFKKKRGRRQKSNEPTKRGKSCVLSPYERRVWSIFFTIMKNQRNMANGTNQFLKLAFKSSSFRIKFGVVCGTT